ncbi:MAG: hypothetical protein QM779_15005 [Propionicimonas sp.]|uniref:hypothetical protein n=1 Tax=Propionicimonas sp. TaxID=1955623 RepID=UPI003D0F8032
MLHVGRPTVPQLVDLSRPQPQAVTVYQPLEPHRTDGTDVAAAIREPLRLALHRLAGTGVPSSARRAIADHVEALGRTASEGHCVAVFACPERAEAFVLPDHLAAEWRAGDRFDLGPLVRAVSSPQTAYAVTVGEEDWGLWWASGTAPVQAVTSGTRENMASFAGGVRYRLGQLWRALTWSRAFLMTRRSYLSAVARTVRARLEPFDPDYSAPMVVFGPPPLGDQLAARLPWRATVSPHDPATLRTSDIGRTLRGYAEARVRRQLSEHLARISDESLPGLPSRDVDEVARAAQHGRVDLLVYDSTASLRDASGADVLARIAVDVLARGGEVLAMEPDELHRGALDGPLLAHLRADVPDEPDDTWPLTARPGRPA